MKRRSFLKMCGMALVAPTVAGSSKGDVLTSGMIRDIHKKALASTAVKPTEKFASEIKAKILMLRHNGTSMDRIYLWVNYQGFKLIDGHIGINSQQPCLYDVPTCISCFGNDDTKPWYCIRWNNYLMGGGPGIWELSYTAHTIKGR